MTQNDSLQNSQDTASESSTTSEETNFTLKKFDYETQNNSFHKSPMSYQPLYQNL
ncbi:hypothetical protein M153_1470008516 [Pseudoloma neurophilia]|uniref:Uncharacterized protein n=1 Tax=Pseudoloma neurophilia TaxID=146866 RepID=A0A0R0LZS9_9MICR|nr:hypothetical protein M153_1470008516 [Pseudoloma neurophilia]